MEKTFLEQWVQGNPVAQGQAKKHEFRIYIPPLLDKLDTLAAQNIVDVQADEGVVSVAFCMQAPGNHAVFVTPQAADDPEGTFRKMAEEITAPARKRNKLTLAASLDDVATASADAILFNNILGCQATLENIEDLAQQAGRIVKPKGHAIITVPNPQGGVFSSYSCDNVPPAGAHGASYDFQMRGEDAVFKNLYLSAQGLKDTFARQGFETLFKTKVWDKAYAGVRSHKPAFFQYVLQKQPHP